MKADLEKLGAFFLGHRLSGEGGAAEPRLDEPVLYDARDLTTHALCVGMTGSGKTGLSAVFLEEAALDGVPAIAIDPKGDLGNLLLTFPELRPTDFEPWIDPEEAARRGRDPKTHAAAVATMWREGLARHGQDGERIRRLEAAVERRIYTPGSTAGRPLSVLGRLTPPTGPTDPEALREEIAAHASALCALLDLDADPITSSPHILLSQLIAHAWAAGRAVELADLVRGVLDPPFDRVGALSLDDFFAPTDRKKLGMRLNNLLASPGFAPWLEGEPLDIESLLRAPDGRPRLSILSIAHLGESERMFFVTLLLSKLVAWMRGQPGTSSLRAMLFMDEVFGFFPPVADPPSKRPMLTLLKQARAFGVGVMLSTQNPVDVDYKGLSNCGTWLLGRLSTERDVDRVVEGLAGAAGAPIDEAALRATLAGLGSRRFLMRNVHEDAPILFETRWAMSYLRGPLTRAQIGALAGPTEAPAAAPTPAAPAGRPKAERPALDASIPQRFLTPLPGRGALEWRPAVSARTQLHYAHRYSGLDEWVTPSVVSPLGRTAAKSWEGLEAVDDLRGADEPSEDGAWLPVPAFVTKRGGLTALAKALKTTLHRTKTLEVYRCAAHKEWSQPGETRAAFTARMEQLAREERDLALAQLREKAAPKLQRLKDRIERAEDKVEREKDQYRASQVNTAVSVGSTVLGALFGRSVVGRATSAARGATRAAKERADVQRAEEDVKELTEELRALEREVEEDLRALREREVAAPPIEAQAVAPRKGDLVVEDVALLWRPYRTGEDGVTREAWRAVTGVG